MKSKSFHASKRASENPLRSPGPEPAKNPKHLLSSRGPLKDESGHSVNKPSRPTIGLSHFTHSETQLENTALNMSGLPGRLSPEAFMDSGAKDQAAQRLRLLEEHLQGSERQFLSVWGATQQQKREEVEGCFAKLSQAIEAARTESLAKLGSYFVSVRKTFLAQKAETEALISRLSFRLRESDPLGVGSIHADLASLEDKLNAQFGLSFRDVSGVRVAYKKSLLSEAPRFCKIDVPEQTALTATPTSAASPYVDKRLVFETEGSPGKGSALASPHLQTSFFAAEGTQRTMGPSPSPNSFLSRGKGGRPAKASSEQMIETHLSLSPVPNGFKQLLKRQEAKADTSLNNGPRSQRTASRPKETAQQILLRALTEPSDVLNLSGTSIDAMFLRKNADTLLRLQCLRVLNLDSNRLSDEVLPVLMDLLPRLPLERLSLQYNQITEAGLPILREICAQRPGPFAVDLTCNDIGLSEERKARFEAEMRQVGASVVL